MCDCINIDMGSYDNQRWVSAPPHMPKENGYCLDECIADEVISLWDKGIVTTGCCCGHNKEEAYIGVIDSHIGAMIRFGYKVKTNFLHPHRIDSFHPKSINQ